MKREDEHESEATVTQEGKREEWFTDAAVVARESLRVDPGLARRVRYKALALLARIQGPLGN